MLALPFSTLRGVDFSKAGFNQVKTWAINELSVLDAVRAKFVLSDSDATRFSVKLIDFLLGLGGH